MSLFAPDALHYILNRYSYAVIGLVVVGGGWYLSRLARGPTGALKKSCSNMRTSDLVAVVWTKENPTPWNDIKPDEGTKLLTVNQHFEKGCVVPQFISSIINDLFALEAGSVGSCKTYRPFSDLCSRGLPYCLLCPPTALYLNITETSSYPF